MRRLAIRALAFAGAAIFLAVLLAIALGVDQAVLALANLVFRAN